MDRRIKKSRGRPRIDPNLRFLNIRITKKQDEFLHKKSIETNIPICALIRIALNSYFEKELESIDDEWKSSIDDEWEKDKDG